MNDPARELRVLTALSHDIRSPLNAMTFTLAILEQKLGDSMDAEDRADFDALRSGLDAILTLHEGSLDLARLAGGRSILRTSDVEVDAVLLDCLRLATPLAARQGLAVAFDLRFGGVVRSDPAMIRRIVANLLSNAIRYTPKGSITVASRAEGPWARVDVIDTGVGIAPEDRRRIFEEYYRVDPPGGDGDGDSGLGLGLTVARRLAELLGGALSVASEPGRGSRFTLSLPRSRYARELAAGLVTSGSDEGGCR